MMTSQISKFMNIPKIGKSKCPEIEKSFFQTNKKNIAKNSFLAEITLSIEKYKNSSHQFGVFRLFVCSYIHTL